MSKKQLVHLFHPDDVVRSVLKGHKITASCGLVKVVTREEVTATNEVKVCADCVKSCNEDYEQWTVNSPRGWTALLEKVWLAEHTPQSSPNTFTYTFNTTTNWGALKRFDFPPAA